MAARPWHVLALGLALTVAAAWYLQSHLRINTDNEDMLAADLPFRQDSAALAKAFPQFSDNLVVVVEADGADMAEQGARRLSSRLARSPAIFGEVYAPDDDPFIQRNGLLYLDTEELQARADRLIEAQPLMATLASDPTVRGFAKLLGLGVTALEDNPSTNLDLSRFLDATSQTVRRHVDGRPGTFPWHELLAADSESTAIDDVPARRLLVLQPRLDFGSLSYGSDALEGVRETALALGLTPDRGVRVRLTGSAALASEELASVEEGMGLAGLVSIALVTLSLVIGFGSTAAAFAVLVTLVMGLIWTTALALLAVEALNLLSVAFVVLFIGLAVDFGIHYVLRFRECALTPATNSGAMTDADRAPGPRAQRHQALANAASRAGGPLTLCAATSAIAFYSFLPTDYVGLAQLGLIAGTGMIVALITTLTVLPALLEIITPRWSPAQKMTAVAVPPARSGHRAWITLGVLCIGLMVALAQAPNTRFDFDPLNLKDTETESVATLFDLHRDGKPVYTIDILTKDLSAARDLAQKLRALPGVDRVETVDDFVPSDQTAKLDVIDDLILALGPWLNETDGPPPSINDSQRRNALAKLATHAQRIAQLTTDKALAAAAMHLYGSVQALGPSPIDIAGLEHRLTGDLLARFGRLHASLDASAFDLGALPKRFVDRWVAQDGQARLEVFPTEDLRDRAALHRFVTSVRAVAPRATGAPVVILEASRTVLSALLTAATIASVIIAALLLVVMRRPASVCLVFAPVVAAGILTLGLTNWLEIPFNYANVIVLPLLFGLVVDFGVHLVARSKEEGAQRDLFETSTPRAVAVSAFTTVGSFGTIMLSSHPGTASMGLLLTLALALGLICALTIIPAVKHLSRDRHDSPN